jgi:hypothetical protein
VALIDVLHLMAAAHTATSQGRLDILLLLSDAVFVKVDAGLNRRDTLSRDKERLRNALHLWCFQHILRLVTKSHTDLLLLELLDG